MRLKAKRVRSNTSDELLDRELIDPARTRRSEAVEHGHFGMIEVGESENDPTIVQFGFSLSHAGGPPLRSMKLRHRRAWAKSRKLTKSGDFTHNVLFRFPEQRHLVNCCKICSVATRTPIIIRTWPRAYFTCHTLIAYLPAVDFAPYFSTRSGSP